MYICVYKQSTYIMISVNKPFYQNMCLINRLNNNVRIKRNKMKGATYENILNTIIL